MVLAISTTKPSNRYSNIYINKDKPEMSKTKKDLYRKHRNGKVLKSNEFKIPKGWVVVAVEPIKGD